MKAQTRPVIERLLATASAIATEPGIKTRELAEQLEVSVKTVARDRDFLRDRLLVNMHHDALTRRWTAEDRSQVLPLVKTLAMLR
jgi:predicted DNA-binding transcriptional regulator YafY